MTGTEVTCRSDLCVGAGLGASKVGMNMGDGRHIGAWPPYYLMMLAGIPADGMGISRTP